MMNKSYITSEFPNKLGRFTSILRGILSNHYQHPILPEQTLDPESKYPGLQAQVDPLRVRYCYEKHAIHCVEDDDEQPLQVALHALEIYLI